VLRSIIDLQAAINRNLEQHNDDPKPFIWTKPAYPILAKLDRLPVPLRGSLLTLRWREMDSNPRSPVRKPRSSKRLTVRITRAALVPHPLGGQNRRVVQLVSGSRCSLFIRARQKG
jgi:hypothetical protein